MVFQEVEGSFELMLLFKEAHEIYVYVRHRFISQFTIRDISIVDRRLRMVNGNNVVIQGHLALVNRDVLRA